MCGVRFRWLRGAAITEIDSPRLRGGRRLITELVSSRPSPGSIDLNEWELSGNGRWNFLGIWESDWVPPARHRIQVAGLQRDRAQDFQSYSTVRVSLPNCLMSKERLATASCAGVTWNEPEHAGVGHNLGTNWLLLDRFVRPQQQGLRDRRSLRHVCELLAPTVLLGLYLLDGPAVAHSRALLKLWRTPSSSARHMAPQRHAVSSLAKATCARRSQEPIPISRYRARAVPISLRASPTASRRR